MAAGNSISNSSRPSRAVLPAQSFALFAVLVFLAICAALWLAAWRIQGSAAAWPRFEDDAYYYLVIARNVASGYGFTADRLSPTNGFQPLWMWLLVPVAWLTSGDATGLLAATQLLVVVTFSIAGGLLFAFLRARSGLLPALCAAGLLLFPPYSNVLLSGLESGIAVLVFVLLVRELVLHGVLEPREARRADLRSGVLLGLLMLARLDAVFVGLALTGYLAAVEWARSELPLGARVLRVVRRELAVFSPTLALVAPYLAWNAFAFGHVVPISGALKTSLAVPGLRLGNLTWRCWVLIALAVAAAAVEQRRARDPGLRPVLTALAAGVLVQALYAVVFMHWAVFAWHYAVFVPAGGIGAAVLSRAFLERVPRRAHAWVGAALALFLSVAQALAISRLHLTFTAAAREAGLWVSQSLPADAVVGMKDSGAFSYFTRQRVMNLDGMVNSFAYEEALCRGELAAFLRSHRVGYVAQHAVPPEVRSGQYETFAQRYPCHFPGGRDSELVFRREHEVFRGSPYHTYRANGREDLDDQVVIWRIAPGES